MIKKAIFFLGSIVIMLVACNNEPDPDPGPSYYPNVFNLQALGGINQVTLTWDTPQGLTAKEVEISYRGQDKKLTILPPLSNRNEAVIEKLNLGEEYQFTVKLLYGQSRSKGITIQATPRIWCQKWQQGIAPPWGAKFGHAALVYKDEIWVMGGLVGSLYTNDVWHSADGENWQPATVSAGWSPRYGHMAAVFRGRLWILGGVNESQYSNDVWSSEDGVNWIKEAGIEAAKLIGKPFQPARTWHAVTVYRDKLWVLGGQGDGGKYLNDVWYSEDGKNWWKINTANHWDVRIAHAALVYRDKLWIIGGHEVNTFFNDVWWTQDGYSWMNNGQSAPWTPRHSQRLVFDNRIWLFGEHDKAGGLNDIWYSSDGIDWQQVTISSPYPAREHGVVLFFKKRIWLLGGGTKDIWYTE